MSAEREKAQAGAAVAEDRTGAVPQSIPALMAWALWLELDAAERYRELADAMEMHNNREVGALFRKMETIEGKHAESIMHSMEWTSPPPRPRGEAPWPGFEAPENVAHEDVHYLMQPWHALTLALKGEERAVRFFTALANESTVPAVQAAAREMAAEEQEHVDLVRAWLARVPPPDERWRDDPDPPRYLD
ncbi:MAG: rubrerythrin [Burkholderiales bacterium]|jgi:rubrerythrin|nr:rubrerythrin [Burkholderiales bacterium]